jgi:hypothetical protein
MTFTSLSKYLQDWNNGGQNDREPPTENCLEGGE